MKAIVCKRCGCIVKDVGYGRKNCCCGFWEKEGLEEVDLTGRKAICPECGKLRDSNPELPFWKYRKHRETDEFYCGCYGWE